MHQNRFRARALLDSGSGTNFVSKDILPLLQYESLGSRELELSGINSTQRDRYELVRIFILSEQCPIKTLKCYVHPGPMSYEIEPTKYREVVEQCKNLQGFSDSFSIAVDHKQSQGLILAPGAI